MSQLHRLEKQRTAFRQAVSRMQDLPVTPDSLSHGLYLVNPYYSGWTRSDGVWLVLSDKVVTKKHDAVIEGYRCLKVRDLTLDEQTVSMEHSWVRSEEARQRLLTLSEIPRAYAHS